MAHELMMRVPSEVPIANADIEIIVRVDEVLLGTLKVSKGSIDWKPKGARSDKRLTWDHFAELMAHEGSTAAAVTRVKKAPSVTGTPAPAAKTTAPLIGAKGSARRTTPKPSQARGSTTATAAKKLSPVTGAAGPAARTPVKTAPPSAAPAKKTTVKPTPARKRAPSRQA